MFSDIYGSVTTTFIRNEVVYLYKKFDLVYLTQKVEGDSGNVRTHCVPYRENMLKRKINWYLWKLDLKCSFKNRKYAEQLNDFIRKERPDIIHCHFAYEAIKLLQNIDKEFKLPVFVHFHGYDASQMLRKKSYVRALQQSFNRINVIPLVVSSKMKSNLEKAGVPTGHAEIIRCGIDLKIFKEASVASRRDEIVFLQISSLVEKKGHEYSLKAFSLFFNKNPSLKKNVKIIFSGDKPDHRIEELQKVARDLGIDKNISFIGNVSISEAVTLLSNAHVFVHHSVTAKNGEQEGIPTAIMEAMAMKLPVLSTFHAGIPELVKNGVNGFLCEERDVQTYARQIEEIIHWPKLAINRAVVEEDYNIEKHNRQLENLYAAKIKLI